TADSPIVWNVNLRYAEGADPNDYDAPFVVAFDQIDLAKKKTLRSFDVDCGTVSPAKLELDGNRLILHGYGKGGFVDLETQAFTSDSSQQFPYVDRSTPLRTSSPISRGRLVRTASAKEKGRLIHAIEIVD